MFNNNSNPNPFMNRQMPPMPFPMPTMPFGMGQMPFGMGQMPPAFNPMMWMNGFQPPRPAEGEGGQPGGCDPFAWFRLAQMPFPFPNPLAPPTQGEPGEAESPSTPWTMPGMDEMAEWFNTMKTRCDPAGFSLPFGMPTAEEWKAQQVRMPTMDQWLELGRQWLEMGRQWMEMYQALCKSMVAMFGVDPQIFAPDEGKNPFSGLPGLEEVAGRCRETAEKWKSKAAGKDGKEGALPFGLPAKLLQQLLNMDSTPEGLTKFQKLLDMLFEAYSKPRAAESAAEESEPTAEPAEEAAEPAAE